FVFHGAEERGLLGSRYFVAHPVVPLQQIVAVLNGDMIGRNHPDTAALMGSQPPHRNSIELVRMAIDANAATSKFVIDSLWDRPTHPEGWYFRSDHVPYAERNVPALFFSTNLPSDYHTPRDEPKNINYPKLTRVTQWMYMTGWIAANAANRPAMRPGLLRRGAPRRRGSGRRSIRDSCCGDVAVASSRAARRRRLHRHRQVVPAADGAL